MNIHLHIDRLVLDAALLPRGGTASQVRAALEKELAHLLPQGLNAGLLDGLAAPSLAIPDLPARPVASATLLGRDVARSLYQSIGSSPPNPQPNQGGSF